MIAIFALLGLAVAPAHAASDIDEVILAGARSAKITSLSAPRDQPAELVALGRMLFEEPRLSGNRNITCRSCHDPARGTGDGMPLSFGEGGALLPRHTPALYNLGQPDVSHLFWDSRVSLKPTAGFKTPEPGLNGLKPSLPAITQVLGSALAAQTLFPLLSPDEMRGKPGSNPVADAATNVRAWELLVERLMADAMYREAFERAFPDTVGTPVHIGHVGRALAAYITVAFDRRNTPWDRYLSGDLEALTPQQKRGAALFVSDQTRCTRCHKGPMLSDFETHTVATPQIGPGFGDKHTDFGGFPVIEGIFFSFRTPPLRNVGLTAPYTHSGAFLRLRDVVVHYVDPTKSLSSYRVDEIQLKYGVPVVHEVSDNAMRIGFISQDIVTPPVTLNDSEIDDLVEFLERGLTDEG